jgi:isopentenyl diphosphate isomerase/L-lactate dehydrogenase-like FMN-dependent dehydrogenase
VQKTLITPGFTWEDLARLRERWTGKLLVKGILHPDDAVRCAGIGCDGIAVSNHGGRQVAFGPSTVEALPAIIDAVAGQMQIIVDSGVRRGADIVRAKALGADFTFAGRALAYGVGAGGVAGATRAFEIIRLELERALGQLGCPSFETADASLLTMPRRQT